MDRQRCYIPNLQTVIMEKKDITIEDVLEKEFNEWEKLIPKELSELLSDFAMNHTYPVRGVLRNLFKAASLNRQGWTRVEDGLPTENDTSDYWYDEVMTLQVGRRRPTFMKYWEVKNCPFTKYWMPLPNKPSI